jgi:hypothetical protein
MIAYFNNDEDITIGVWVRFKDVPRIYFTHHQYRTPHRNSRLIVSDEGDTIFTWIYDKKIWIRTKSGTDLSKDRYSKVEYPTMNGLMKSCNRLNAEGKKKDVMRIHHLVFVTFSDEKTINRYFGGLTIDHMNRNKEDCRWVNLRLATHKEQSKNQSVKKGKGHVHKKN